MSSAGDPPSSSLREAVDAFILRAERDGFGDTLADLPPAVARRIGEGAVLGDFELVRRLGEGGMGVVFEALQRSVSNRRVALKVMHDPLGSPEGRLRFRREIAAIARLDHPSIVTVLDADIEEGTPYFAMKYIGGVSLSRLIDTLRAEHVFPPSAKRLSELTGTSVEEDFSHWAARIAARLADALQHAHDRGVIHRDVKPSNVVLTEEGSPALVDFGLASMDTDASQSRDGGFLGTLAYAAPEQLRGEAGDERSDVYSLAATLYELLALIRPFAGRTRTDLVRKIGSAEPPTLPAHVPRDLCRITAHALAADPARRYPTAADLGADLREFLAGRPISVRKPSLFAIAARSARRHPTVTAILLVLFVAGLAYVRDRRARAGIWAARGGQMLGRAMELREQLEGRRLEYWTRTQALDGSPLPMDGPGPDSREMRDLAASILSLEQAVEEDYRRAESDLLSALMFWGGLPATEETLARLYEDELTSALFGFEDVLDPERVASLEQRLKPYAHTETRRALLQHQGSLDLTTAPTAAAFELFTADAWANSRTPIRTGRSPATLEGLEEGSYVLHCRHPGYVETLYPLLVRRTSIAEARPFGPQPEVTVELLASEELEPGYAWIPSGWTLVDERPIRWAKVPSFQIEEFEVSFQAWVDWMNRRCATGNNPGLCDPASPTGKPRFPGGRDWFVRRDTSGSWATATGTDPNWPVRGISIHDASMYASGDPGSEAPLSSGWYRSLPTRTEWVRAARGSDARAFPWLGPFHWKNAGGYSSRGAEDHEPMPYVRGAFPADCSVFGVRDMAGSVREFTGDLFGPIRDIYAVSGGSYRSPYPEDMAIARVTGIPPTPQYDVGLRLVRRRLPEVWIRPRPGAPFEDTFDRADGPIVGEDWIEVGSPPGFLSKHRAERIVLKDGAMLCRGDVGNDSVPGVALHALPSIDGPFAARIWFRAGWKVGRSGEAFRLELDQGMTGSGPQVSLRAGADGTGSLHVSFGGPGKSVDVTDIFPAAATEVRCVELGLGASRVRLRLLEPEDPGKVLAERSLALPDGFRPPAFVGFTGSQLAGGWIEVRRIEVRAWGETSARASSDRGDSDR